MIAACLVVDDEPFARKLMASHISKVETLSLSGTCGNALEAINIIQQKRIDLLFLDIRMPQIDGIQLIKTLKNPPAIILTTAYREFAVDAFDLNVLDYLLKPISFERFLKAVNKYFDLGPSRPDPTQQGEDFILVTSGRKTVKIPLDQILFVESMDETVKIHLADREIVTRENISSLAQTLPLAHFVRVHRSFIVAIPKIQTITAEGIEVGGKFIPFGRAFRQGALKALGL